MPYTVEYLNVCISQKTNQFSFPASSAWQNIYKNISWLTVEAGTGNQSREQKMKIITCLTESPGKEQLSHYSGLALLKFQEGSHTRLVAIYIKDLTGIQVRNSLSFLQKAFL